MIIYVLNVLYVLKNKMLAISIYYNHNDKVNDKVYPTIAYVKSKREIRYSINR